MADGGEGSSPARAPPLSLAWHPGQVARRWGVATGRWIREGGERAKEVAGLIPSLTMSLRSILRGQTFLNTAWTHFTLIPARWIRSGSRRERERRRRGHDEEQTTRDRSSGRLARRRLPGLGRVAADPPSRRRVSGLRALAAAALAVRGGGGRAGRGGEEAFLRGGVPKP
jgi:hypothetical protein